MAARHVAAVQFPGQKRVLIQVDPSEDTCSNSPPLSLYRSMVSWHFSVGKRRPKKCRNEFSTRQKKEGNEGSNIGSHLCLFTDLLLRNRRRRNDE